MTTVGIYDAKTKFSAYAHLVFEKGETVIITKNGKKMCKLVPLDDEEDNIDYDQLVKDMIAFRDSNKPGPESTTPLLREIRRRGR